MLARAAGLQAVCGGAQVRSVSAAAQGAKAVRFPDTPYLTTIYNYQQNDPGFMAGADVHRSRRLPSATTC
jgi:hypothetical protein